MCASLHRAMHFPKFWARAEHEGFGRWGFSDDNTEDARLRALERARVIAERFRAGEQLGRYGYPDRPMREPVLQSFSDSSGKPAGAITRNSYGCAVLNAAQMFIADVEVPNSSQRPGLVQKLFGGGGREIRGSSESPQFAAALRKVKEAASSTAGLCLIYRTAVACA